jgi:hypothetical protein
VGGAVFLQKRRPGTIWACQNTPYPARDDALQMWSVSKRVNSSRAPDDDQTLIDRITA